MNLCSYTVIAPSLIGFDLFESEGAVKSYIIEIFLLLALIASVAVSCKNSFSTKSG